MLNFDAIDEDDLRRDMVSGLFENWNELDELDKTDVLVWNDPWHASGWEITGGFARRGDSYSIAVMKLSGIQ